MSDVSQTGESGANQIAKDARTWAMFCHLAGLGWMLIWVMPIVGGVVGAMIFWQIKKDQYPFVDEHGKEALNFQISMLIYWLVSVVLCFCVIGVVIMPILAVVDVVCAIIAAVKAGNGEYYRYPLSIRFLK